MRGTKSSYFEFSNHFEHLTALLPSPVFAHFLPNLQRDRSKEKSINFRERNSLLLERETSLIFSSFSATPLLIVDNGRLRWRIGIRSMASKSVHAGRASKPKGSGNYASKFIIMIISLIFYLLIWLIGLHFDLFFTVHDNEERERRSHARRLAVENVEIEARWRKSNWRR